MIYLDNAATSFPKPDVVIDAMRLFMTRCGANPGRSGHSLSAEAARVVYDCRERLARLFGAEDSRQVIFTPNATGAINLALRGFLRAGDHVVTTSMEHNSVTRPLRYLMEEGEVTVTQVLADAQGRIDAAAIGAARQAQTRLVIVPHVSNVVGAITPLAEIRAAIGSTPLLVDAAQSGGALSIDVVRDGIDLLAFTGHKSLLGPQGVGGLVIGPDLELEPLIRGGTGSDSESDVQPDVWPDRYESGTPNGPGIAGLGAAVDHLLAVGIESVRRREQELCARLLEGLGAIDAVTLFGPTDPTTRLPIVSLRLRGRPANEVTYLLDRRYGIMTRSGLHCAPAAHRTLGTAPEGTVRLSANTMNTNDDIDRTIEAIAELAREAVS